MLFPTTDFAIFFVVVFVAHWLLQPCSTKWKLFIVAASYVFYAWWDPRFVWLLAAVTVFGQLGGVAVSRTRGRPQGRAILMLAIGLTLSPLLYFKYYAFFTLNLANSFRTIGVTFPLPLLQIVLPVGISFFTFMAIAYIVDIYRRDYEPVPWLDFFVYLSFFPHLVAGPIVRAYELVPQFSRRVDPRRIDFSRGAFLIMSGLFKKLVISSYLAAAIVDPTFADPGRHSALEALLAAYGYAIVIYCDFSGYSDIAIGVAKLLGFEFPQNFNRPYSATSLRDFWQRWHMTLSRWLRDYLYIPLGGSRRGEGRTYAAILITMVLGGLWHGAAWTFVVWGALHGGGQAVARWRRRVGAGERRDPGTDVASVWQRIATFNLVCLGWVFFRADSLSTAFALLGRLVTGWTTTTTLVTPLVVLVTFGALALQQVPGRPSARFQYVFSRLTPAMQGVLLAVALFVITTLGPQGVAPFIYFQF